MKNIAETSKKRAPVSQNTRTDQLKTAAKGRGRTQKKPRRPREYSTNPDSQYLTPSEKDRLFKVIKSPRDRAIFRLVYHRGLRSSEPGLLKLSDWNDRDRLLFVRRGKNSISRDHPLTSVERTALRAWLKIRGNEPGPLFPSRQERPGGLGIHRNRLDQLFREYCRAAGIRPEKAHMHVLKHSCGTHLSELGESAATIQDVLGHRAASSTAIYMHYSQRLRTEAAARLENWK